MAEERVLIEGYLHKLGRMFKGWHRRYFRIKGSHMYYYKRVVGGLHFGWKRLDVSTPFL